MYKIKEKLYVKKIEEAMSKSGRFMPSVAHSLIN